MRRGDFVVVTGRVGSGKSTLARILSGLLNPDSGAIYSSVLEPDVALLEKGLDTLVGPRGVRLSGGQVQRSAAARMFVRDPELLVFDDLSSALDVETEQLLWKRLDERRAAASGDAMRRDLPGGIAPPPGAAPRRLDRGAEGWAHRSPGQAGRPAGDQR